MKIKNNILSEKRPDLAKEWHPTKNGDLTPNDATCGVNKKVWWQCSKGHEWEAAISSRNRGSGCPYCSNKKVCIDNSLAILNPELANKWHPTKNRSLTPYDVTCGSGKVVWWQCEKGHVWKASTYTRNKGIGCPYCAGQKVCADNSLNKLNPELSKEWHLTKNGELTPNDVTCNNNKKVWWQCFNGHEWESTIYNRNSGRGCPYCGGKKTCEDNSLATLNPKLAKEWHPAKNGDTTPNDVTCGSNKKIWWNCHKGHEWRAVIARRNRGSGCPYCAGQKVCSDNSLNTLNSELAKEWHHTKNGNLTPNNITVSYGKRVWWKCSKGHEWEAVVASRATGKGCPCCSGRKVHIGNSLAILNPELAKEWHLAKNEKITPNDVTCNSSKKVWWKCSKGHEWESTVDNRNRGRGCPHCHKEKRKTQLPKYLKSTAENLPIN